MTTLREAAKQALEALGLWATGRDMDAVKLNDLIHELEAALEQEQAGPLTGLDMFLDPQDGLKPKRYKPKAEPAQEHEDWCASVTQLLLCDPPKKAPCNCRQRKAEPLNLSDPAVQKRLAAQWGYVPAEQAEPVAWYQKRGQEVLTSHPACWGREDEPWTPLYTAPPQRKLVPLTEEEIEHIGMTSQSLRQVARTVEKASWEKNHG